MGRTIFGALIIMLVFSMFFKFSSMVGSDYHAEMNGGKNSRRLDGLFTLQTWANAHQSVVSSETEDVSSSSSSAGDSKNLSPQLVDFESWKTIISRSEKNSGAISTEGAVCVVPSSLEGRHLDVHGNIYAFGVLLPELISGRPSYCKDKGCLVDWAKEYLELPEVMSYVVDPELKHFRYDDLKVIREVVSLRIKPTPALTMMELCTILESRIDTSVSSELKASSLAWAELALSS